MSNKKIITIVLSICILIILIDQLSKLFIVKNVHERIGNDNFSIEVTENTGMAFGFNSGNLKNILLSGFVILIIVSFIKKQKNLLEPKVLVAISIALGGGISNLVDRIFRGGVLDYIKILFIPNFNIADMCICTGWLLLVIFLVIYTQKEEVFKQEK